MNPPIFLSNTSAFASKDFLCRQDTDVTPFDRIQEQRKVVSNPSYLMKVRYQQRRDEIFGTLKHRKSESAILSCCEYC